MLYSRVLRHLQQPRGELVEDGLTEDEWAAIEATKAEIMQLAELVGNCIERHANLIEALQALEERVAALEGRTLH